MPRLFGRDYTRGEFLRHVGHVSQVGGAREYRIQGGPADGVHAVDVATGSGFRFTVLPGRGMDISHASYNGHPLGWISPAGEVSPWAYEPEGLGWLRTFAGGLLTTCGLTHIHEPVEDDGKRYGLHGRASAQVASSVEARGDWDGDEYRISVRGRTREAALFDEQIELDRTISTELGSSSLRIDDIVSNVGFRTTPHMILYHINLGFPLLGSDAELISPTSSLKDFKIGAVGSDEGPYRFREPEAGYAQNVYDHQTVADSDGMVHAALVNESLEIGPLGLRISYRRAELPHLNEWKLLDAGEYVLGLEPASAGFGGREAARQTGTLKYLEAGESVSYRVEIGVLTGSDEIAAFRDRVKALVEGA